MQKHLVTAKPNECAIQSAQLTGNQWPIAGRPLCGEATGIADDGRLSPRSANESFGPCHRLCRIPKADVSLVWPTRMSASIADFGRTSSQKTEPVISKLAFDPLDLVPLRISDKDVIPVDPDCVARSILLV